MRKIKRTLQNCPKFSTRSLKEQNLAILEVANFAKRFIQTSLKVLFVCRYNRFRSKVGEVFLKRMAGERVDVRSRGFTLDESRPYVAENVKIALKENGIDKVDNTPRRLQEDDIKWADKIIVDANDVPLDGFPKNKTEVWPVEDCSQDDLPKIREITGKIKRDVEGFIGRLGFGEYY